MKKRLLSIFMVLIMAFLLFPIIRNTASAANSIETTYKDQYGVTQNITANKVAADTATLTAGWWVVDTTVTRTSGITVTGDVKLILADGASLSVTGGNEKAGITVSGTGNSLTIYGQANGTGELIAQGGNTGAGIGGDYYGNGGTVTINGGKVTATGGDHGAGIGGGCLGGGGDVTINGGDVTATGVGACCEANGIGYGDTGSSCGEGTVAINGGKVTATGGDDGNGIGGSITVADGLTVKADDNAPPTTVITDTNANGLADELSRKRFVTITPPVKYIDENGHEQSCPTYKVVAADTATLTEGWWVVDTNGITSTSGGITVTGDVKLILADGASLSVTGDNYKAGITVSGTGNSLTIYGQANGTGALNATGAHNSAGIGGDYGNPLGGSGNNITINGGKVTATGGYNSAGIGGSYGPNTGGSGNNITINGGIVIAQGNNCGAGIGGGYGGNTGGSANNITINGGTVTASTTVFGAGIGAGSSSSKGGSVSNIAINGGKVTATGGPSGGSGIGLSDMTSNGETCTGITVAAGITVKADGNNPPTTVITDTNANGLADELSGKRYVTITPPTFTLVLSAGSVYKYSVAPANLLNDTGITGSGNEQDGYTYAFNNVHFTTTAATAINIYDKTAAIILTGTNTVKSGDTTSGASTGIYALNVAETKLSISGEGSLTVMAGNCTKETGYSYGIRAYKLSVTGGTIHATAGSAATISSGVDSCIDISGGTIYATGGSATNSYGISNNTPSSITGGTVIASGNSNAIKTAPTLSDVTVTAGANADGTGAATVANQAFSENLQSYKYAKIQAVLVASVTIDGTTTNYSTLAKAWTAAQAGTEATPATIKLFDNVTGPLENAQNTFVTLDLNGYVLKGAGNNSVITNNGTLTIKDSNTGTQTHKFTVDATTGLWTLNETNGTQSVTGGVITGGSNNAAAGGGVYNSGTLTLESGSIVGNTAKTGGGVFSTVSGSNAAFTMNGGRISGNTANSGAGVNNNLNSTFTMTAGSVTDNTAKIGSGGGILASGTKVELLGGTVSGNKGNGGVGVYNTDFTLGGSIVITGNTQADNTVCNLFVISGKTVKVNADFNGSAGVTMETTPTATTPVAFTSNGTSADVSKFTSDSLAYRVRFVEASGTAGQPDYVAAHLELAGYPITKLTTNTTAITLEKNDMTEELAKAIVEAAVADQTGIIVYAVSSGNYSYLKYESSAWSTAASTKTFADLKTGTVYLIGTISEAPVVSVDSSLTNKWFKKDETVTLTGTYTSKTPPTITVGGNAATVNTEAKTWSYTYTDATNDTTGTQVTIGISDGTDSSSVNYTLKVDTVAPEITVTPTADGYVATGSDIHWYKQGATVSVKASATDATSNVASMTKDSNAYTAGTNDPLTTTAEMDQAYTHTFGATDNAGNSGSETFKFNVDGGSPSITNIAVSNSYESASGYYWVKQGDTVTVSATVTDTKSGVKEVTFGGAVSTGTDSAYSKAYTTSAEAAQSNYDIAAKDNVENGSSNTVYIGVDGTAPAITDNTPDLENPAETLTFILNATDTNGSGVKEAKYAIDGGTKNAYTIGSSVTVEENCTLTFYFYDNVGNEATKEYVIENMTAILGSDGDQITNEAAKAIAKTAITETNKLIKAQKGFNGNGSDAAESRSIQRVLGAKGYVNISLSGIGMNKKASEATGNAKVISYTFDVTPYDNAGIEQHQLTKEVSFRLPLNNPDKFSYALLYHEGTLVKEYSLGNKDYIEVTSKTFSEYSYTLTDSSIYSSESYSVKVSKAKNGSVSVSPKSASAGTTVTITVTPDKGYTLETLTVKDAKGNEIELTAKKLGETYTFWMPSSNVTVEATFMEGNSMLNYFVDVKASDYFYDAVLWAATNGITSGVDDLHFAPNAVTTRGQMVTFLWRAAGSPEPTATTCRFVDVKTGEYYYKAVLWAVEKGITKGMTETVFAPNATVTRGQCVAFLARYEGVKDDAIGYTHSFTDVTATDYYNNAVAWAATNKITAGATATTFAPNDVCTRGQIVTFLYRDIVK